jgi:hypothetical protein
MDMAESYPVRPPAARSPGDEEATSPCGLVHVDGDMDLNQVLEFLHSEPEDLEHLAERVGKVLLVELKRNAQEKLTRDAHQP